MAFESGSLSFRIFYLQQQYDSGLIDEFARMAAPPIDKLKNDPISGWVTWRHLFDRELTDEACVLGPYLHAQLLKAERKIPPKLLRAHLKMEEELERRARQVEFLPRAAKAEVKQRVIDSLLPSMPPTLNSIQCVVDFRNNLLFSDALSDKQLEAFVPAFRETAGSSPILLTPETAAMRRMQINTNDFDPVSLSPDMALDPPQESAPGMDFLTWVWFIWDTQGGVFHLPDKSEFGIMLEGPLTFYREGQGAHEALLRKGSPLNSLEAFTALVCGKKLRRAKVVIAHNDNVFSAMMDSDFAIRGLKLPKTEQVDPVGRLSERMLMVETFWMAWLSLYDRFLSLRTDATLWPQTLEAMRAWIVGLGERHGAEGGFDDED